MTEAGTSFAARKFLCKAISGLDIGMIVPNPNPGKMTYLYNMDLNQNTTLQIFSSRGNLVKSYDLLPEAHSLEIDLTDHLSGIYVYRIVSNGQIYPGNKIILQK